MDSFYSRLADKRGDDTELRDCVERVVNQLNGVTTTSAAPGMLLGKIQSGKTRGFLGVIARAFDREFDIAVVLTKGTKTLASQTVKRIGADFADFIRDEEMVLFDIMDEPDEMTRSELRRKMIIVAKKQDKNLQRLLDFFDKKYPQLKQRRLLLVDDEADMASVRFVKNLRKDGTKRDERSGDLAQGTIAQQMDDLRRLVRGTAFLQVTATPYSLYLQPEDYRPSPDGFVFFPKRPAFTELLPIHGGYVGGDEYFGDFDSSHPQYYLHVEVEEEEQQALRSSDGRTIRADRLWTSKNAAALRRALVTFLTAVVVRRWQQADQGQKLGRYAMIIHNDTQRDAHDWQWKTVNQLLDAFEKSAAARDDKLRELFGAAYSDLAASVSANTGRMPDREDAYSAVTSLLANGEYHVQRVNSDAKLSPLLDPVTAELRLRAQANIFIGGSILDRGITVTHLIAFYYGRNPKRMQADTVLQHSRMYGARDRQDLAVTRFYTSALVRQRLRKIHKLESVLRQAFQRGEGQDGVVFIQKDQAGEIVPCAPSKVLASEIVSVKADDLYLPSGFDTLPGKHAYEALAAIDEVVRQYGSPDSGTLTRIPIDEAIRVLTLIGRTIELDAASDFRWEAAEGLLRFYARQSDELDLFVATGRTLDKENSGDKSGRSILGTATRRTIIDTARHRPTLILLEQAGTSSLRWRANRKFWWPLIAMPSDAEPCVFSVGAKP